MNIKKKRNRRFEKEYYKIKSRRKLWSRFNWYWAFNKDESGETQYTCNENEGLGFGFFKKNHSLSCSNHAVCRAQRFIKKHRFKKERFKNKLKIKKFLLR